LLWLHGYTGYTYFHQKIYFYILLYI